MMERIEERMIEHQKRIESGIGEDNFRSAHFQVEDKEILDLLDTVNDK